MKTITISRKRLTGDLVILARRDYEHLLTLADARIELEKGLNEALHEVKMGKIIGPFSTSAELMSSLEE